MGKRCATFIVLDGVDGCGKSTQAELLVRRLRHGSQQFAAGGDSNPGGALGSAVAEGHSAAAWSADAAAADVLHLREPGSTALGESLRELLLSREHQLSSAVETLLFTAARRQMLDQIVAPALAAGTHVVCERFHPSTYAYQAVAGALDESAVLDLLRRWACAPIPDRIVLLDIDPERAARRRGAPSDRIEDQGLEYQRSVAQGFRRYAVLAPNVVSVDGDGTADEVAERVWAKVAQFFPSVEPDDQGAVQGSERV